MMKKDNDKDENIDTSDNNIEQVKEQKKKDLKLKFLKTL